MSTLLATKFIVSASALLGRVKDAASVAPKSSVTLPILESILLEVKAGQLTLTASDMQTTLTTAPMAVEASSNLSLCLPAQLLLQTLAGLPDQPITIELDEESHVATLRSFNGKFKLAGENPEEYPRPKPDNGPHISFSLAAPMLLEALRHTLPFTSSDELRPAMTGLYFQADGNRFRFAATDGHRLVQHTIENLAASYSAANTYVITRPGLSLIPKLAKAPVIDVKITLSTARFLLNGATLEMRLIDERYPDYQNVIPISNPNKLLISRAELVAALRRLNIFANKTTHQVRLSLKGSELELSAEDFDFGNSGTEKLSCQYDGEELVIGFNAKFLLETLQVIDSEEITLEMSTPNRAGILKPVTPTADTDPLFLVMPVMLNNF